MIRNTTKNYRIIFLNDQKCDTNKGRFENKKAHGLSRELLHEYSELK
jgi:hypothetical protein